MVQFVPPVKVNVPEVVRALPEPESAAKVMLVTVPDPETVAHVLSPLRKVEALAVPLADKSAVIVPVLVIVPPETFTNVPLPVATEVTVPSYWSVEFTVMVVPLTEVVQFVPPETVKVPELVIAVPEPESAAGVMLVTVPSY